MPQGPGTYGTTKGRPKSSSTSQTRSAKAEVVRVSKKLESYTPMYDALLGTLDEKKKKKDDKWMQKVDKSIERRGTEGKCTPPTKPGCTGKAEVLAQTFRKIAAKRKGK